MLSNSSTASSCSVDLRQAGQRSRAAQDRDTEVEHLDKTFVDDHHVGGLDVAVDDVHPVHVSQHCRDLRGDGRRPGDARRFPGALVVDRRERNRYLQSLDRANEGDLRPLVRFFAELEIGALRSELERPVTADQTLTEGGGALAVLEAGIGRLRELRMASGTTDRAIRTTALANALQGKVYSWLDDMREKIGTLLRTGIDADARATVASAAPPSEEARYWRRQVIQAARSVDFFVNLHDGVWWTRLQVVAFEQKLRYLVFLQKVGRGETGVLTLTVYAEIMGTDHNEESAAVADPVVVSSPTETVTWTWTDSPDTLWTSVADVLDTTLASALAKFTSGLG